MRAAKRRDRDLVAEFRDIYDGQCRFAAGRRAKFTEPSCARGIMSVGSAGAAAIASRTSPWSAQTTIGQSIDATRLSTLVEMHLSFRRVASR
jgi:hypothetical protein